MLLLHSVGEVGLDQAGDEHLTVGRLENVLLFDELKYEGYLSLELGVWVFVVGSESLVNKEVQPKRYVEFLVVDPLLKGEDGPIVYLEFRLGVFQQSSDLLIQGTKTPHEGVVVIDWYKVQPFLEHFHKPLDMAFNVFPLAVLEEFQEGKCQLVE